MTKLEESSNRIQKIETEALKLDQTNIGIVKYFVCFLHQILILKIGFSDGADPNVDHESV
jgi:hypothetical protein